MASVIGRSFDQELVDSFYKLTTGGQSFFDSVYPAYMHRDIARSDVKEIIRRGLIESRGSYKILTQLFNIHASEYKRFLNFLHKHDCYVDFMPFRVYRRPTAVEQRAALPASL